MSFDYEASFRLGHQYASYVVDELAKHDVMAELQPLEFAKSVADRHRFTLYEKDVITAAGVLEVKSSSRVFGSNPKDYPADNLIVDTAHGFASKVRKPVAYCMVSQRTGAIVVVPVSSVALWWQDVKYDKQRQMEDVFLMAPKRVLRSFAELVDWIRAR